MKTVPLVVLLLSMFSADLFAQQNRFLIEADVSESSIALKCDAGCRWTELSMQWTESKEVVITPEGVSRDVSDMASARDTSAFSIRLTQGSPDPMERTDVIRLTSVFGTSWETITVPCAKQSCRFIIDRDGMARSLK